MYNNKVRETLTRKYKIIVFIILVISIFVILYQLFGKLLLTPGFISYGDNSYFFDKQTISSWSPYFSNGITRESVITSYGYNVIFNRIFYSLGMGQELISKVTFFLPILTLLIVSFFILKYLSRSLFLAFTGTLFILLSGITVEYLLFFPVPYFYSVSSIFLLLFITYITYKKSYISWEVSLLIIFLSVFNFHPFFFVIYIFYFSIYSLFFLFKNYLLENVIKISIVFLCIIILNSYWIVPFIFGILSGNSNPKIVYGSGNLDSVSSAYIGLSSICRVILGATYPISSSADIIINPFTVLSSFSIFLLFVYFLTFSKNMKNNFYTYIVVVFLIFLGLSFWPTNLLIKDIWSLLWSNVPVFKFFRSFNRFSIVLIPLIFFTIAISYKNQKNTKAVNYFLVISLLLLLMGRIKIMNGEFGGFIPVYEIPREYRQLNSYLKNNRGRDSKIVSYPKTDYEVYIWNKNSNYTEFRQIYYLIEVLTEGKVLQNKAANHLLNSDPFYKNIFDPNYCLSSEKFIEDLAKIDIDYILLQKDLINMKGDIVRFSDYRDCLQNNYFSLLLDNEYFELYKINYGPEYEKKYKINEIYPFYYAVSFDFNGKDKAELVFPQNFNSGWKLYRNDSSNSNFLQRNLIPFYNRELKVQNINNEPGNKWVLRREDFTEDKINLNLYYYPQIYVFIGSTVTIITLISLIGFGIYLLVKKMRSKKYVQQSNI